MGSIRHANLGNPGLPISRSTRPPPQPAKIESPRDSLPVFQPEARHCQEPRFMRQGDTTMLAGFPVTPSIPTARRSKTRSTIETIISELAPILDVSANLVVGAVEGENQGSALALENQSVVKGVTALDKIAKDSQTYPSVQMRAPVRFGGGAHGIENGCQPLVREAAQTPPKRCGGLELHSFKSAMLETPRTVPARRSWAICRRMRTLATAMAFSSKPYSSLA